MIKLYLFDISNADDHWLRYLPTPPIPIQQKIDVLKFRRDRIRTLVSDYFIRKILSYELGVSVDSISIALDPFGKPILKDHSRYFNLSHSGEYIVLATDDNSIGIDIEQVKPIEDLMEVVSFFSLEEQKEFAKQEEPEKLSFFYTLWVLKESYIKALGQGLEIALDSFSILRDQHNILLSNPKREDDLWYFKEFNCIDGYKCAVCAKHSDFPSNFQKIQVKDLIQF